jgi:hypothetical protein
MTRKATVKGEKAIMKQIGSLRPLALDLKELICYSLLLFPDV